MVSNKIITYLLLFLISLVFVSADANEVEIYEYHNVCIEAQQDGSYDIVSTAAIADNNQSQGFQLAALKAKTALARLYGEKIFYQNSSFQTSTDVALAGVKTLKQHCVKKDNNRNLFVVTVGVNSKIASAIAQMNGTYDELSQSVFNKQLVESGLFAKNTLGKLEDAKQKYPHVFSNIGVLEITLKGIPCYVFSGIAETDEQAKDEDIYSQACADAKTKLHKFVTGGKSESVVSLSMCMVMYQYKQDNYLKTILIVPQKNVSVKNKNNCSATNDGTGNKKK